MLVQNMANCNYNISIFLYVLKIFASITQPQSWTTVTIVSVSHKDLQLTCGIENVLPMYLSLTSLTCLDGLSKFYPKQITTKSAVMWNKCCVHNKCIDIFYASPCKNRFLISTFTHSNTILRKNSYIF